MFAVFCTSLLILLFLSLVFLKEGSEESAARPKVFVIMGAPGAGKGSQAMRLAEEWQIPHVSTGDLFRDNLRQNTCLGKQVREYIDTGRLVPDALVVDLLFDRVEQKDCENGYILDGFPRTLEQAQAMEKRLGDSKELVVLNLDVPDEEIIARIINRLVCESCNIPYHKISAPPAVEGVCDSCRQALKQRSDDQEAVVQDRLKVYHQQTAPVEEFYREKNLLKTVDGCQSFEEVFMQLKQMAKSRQEELIGV